MAKWVWQISGAILGAWGVAYAGFWLASSGCFAAFTLECANAPVEPIRAFVMLDWVIGYQTLLGGILALAAGSFVLIAARSQLEHTRREEVRRRVNAILAGLAIAKLGAALAVRTLDEGNGREAERSAETLRTASASLAPHSPGFAEVIALGAHYVQRGAGVLNAVNPVVMQLPDETAKIDHGIGSAMLLQWYLRDPTKLFDSDGRRSSARLPLPSFEREIFIKTRKHVRDFELAEALFVLPERNI